MCVVVAVPPVALARAVSSRFQIAVANFCKNGSNSSSAMRRYWFRLLQMLACARARAGAAAACRSAIPSQRAAALA